MGLHPFRHTNPGVGGEKKIQTPDRKLPVSEIFLSIQGEGVHAGTPSVFLRTYFCNLSCTWCDTKYTWLNQAESKEGVDYKSLEAREVVRQISGFHCGHLVVTGGEPLLHQEALLPILSDLKQNGFFIEVETNGTMAPEPGLTALVDCFNVSPKTSNSKVEQRLRVREASLSALLRSRKAWFKFVISEPADIKEVEELVGELELPQDRVILMPEGTDAEAVLSRGAWLAGACEEKGYRFSPRLQILLFGNRRGT
ncbi:MAG TPA: 7-carboxy-7-deazaguanine synthase QueE [Nitrososphaerales archaeon]|nr:7-carboxy-7-deazaguanine synthase QueE [Nitrososphaerales archaeon]